MAWAADPWPNPGCTCPQAVVGRWVGDNGWTRCWTVTGSEEPVVWWFPPHSGEPREAPPFLRPMASGLEGQDGLSRPEGLPASRGRSMPGERRSPGPKSPGMGPSEPVCSARGTTQLWVGRAVDWTLGPCGAETPGQRREQRGGWGVGGELQHSHPPPHLLADLGRCLVPSASAPRAVRQV